MSSALFETIMDFGRNKVDASIRCAGCGHMWRLTSAELGATSGLGERIVSARARCRCSACGHRGARFSPVPRLD